MIQSEYDIVIVGAGSAGISAAISASNQGNSVLLIEKSHRIGGMATKSEVGTICGLYLNDSTSNFKMNVGEFTMNFAENIQKLSNSTPKLNSSGLQFLPYLISQFESYCEEILREKEIEIIKDASLIKVFESEFKIDSIQIEINDTKKEVKVKSIIDASGVNTVSQLAGEILVPISFLQTKTHVFTVSDIDFVSEDNLAFILLLKLKGELNISIVPGSYTPKKVSLKLNFNDLSEDESVFDKIESSFLTLKSIIQGFAHSKLDSIAEETGVRIGERAIGKYTLTEKDVLSCRKFKDSAAIGNWPIEQWDAEKGLIIKKIAPNDFYQIPKDCLRSNYFPNLFFAGRNVSADENAIGSARVIGTCMQTGFSAGELAKEFVNNLK